MDSINSKPLLDEEQTPRWTFDTHCQKMQWNALAGVKLVTGSATLGDADLVVICVFVVDHCNLRHHNSVLKGWAHLVDQGLKGALQHLLDENGRAIAKLGSVTPTLRTIGTNATTSNSKRYVLLSLGKQGDDDLALGGGLIIGRAIAAICSSEKKVVSASVHLPDAVAVNAAIMRDVSTGFYEQLYTDNRFHQHTGGKSTEVDVKEVRILTEGGFVGQDPLTKGRLVAKGVILTKDIVNAPHRLLNSESLAETAKRVAAESNGRIKCEILGSSEECEARGVGANLMGSARHGSGETEPQFIHLTYTPSDGKIHKKVGVVAKGLFFDTGCYNNKSGMAELVNFDCGGPAAVLGAARAIGDLEPPGVEAHFIVAVCENATINGGDDDNATVPSDNILTADNSGTTITVMINADAEGRLTLADALVRTEQDVGCESVVEQPTFTGACMLTLGNEICGLWTDDDAMAADLADISNVTGDRALRMPMAKEYREQLRSKFSDLQNIGNRHGGPITAALFLQNFVDDKIPVAHIDVECPVWRDRTGATGFGAKMIIEWVTRQGK